MAKQSIKSLGKGLLTEIMAKQSINSLGKGLLTEIMAIQSIKETVLYQWTYSPFADNLLFCWSDFFNAELSTDRLAATQVAGGEGRGNYNYNYSQRYTVTARLILHEDELSKHGA